MALFETISEEEKAISDLVKFEDILITYNKNYNLIVNFTLAPELKGSSLDWIGIFHGGWNKYESFLAFEWGIGEPVDSTGRKRRIIFDSKYLRTAKSSTLYQFVYISKYLEILGVSQFFQFTDDDQKTDSLCLNETFLINNVHNSTEYQENPDESLEIVNNESVSSSMKRARPSCSINVPDNWLTTCWRCKSLFEMKNKHNALIEKLNLCNEQNELLKERVNKLEIALQNVWMPQTLINPWDEEKERTNYQQFVSVMSDSVDDTKGLEKGDHSNDNKAIVQCQESSSLSSCYDYFFNEGTSRELFLKAIIGNQERHIRDLNKKIVEMNRIVFQRIPKSITNSDVVTLVKAKERIIPELIDIKCNEDDENNADNNIVKDINNEEN